MTPTKQYYHWLYHRNDKEDKSKITYTDRTSKNRLEKILQDVSNLLNPDREITLEVKPYWHSTNTQLVIEMKFKDINRKTTRHKRVMKLPNKTQTNSVIANELFNIAEHIIRTTDKITAKIKPENY